ncbi:MAG TPA: hypothetical protein VN752_06680, partial [Solirubrobacterales bacterium]|nr:hypothetical protein [Solirubrobacterales bacterium]
YACQDVYEWNDGALSLLTPGTGDSGFAIVGPTRTGESVFFTTGERLVGWDGDAARDIYVARVGGGFAEPAPAPAGCEGEGCRGAGSGTSQASGAGTAVFEGPGDAAPQRKCKKGSVKRRGQCVKKQRRRHRRAANNHRRAAR